MPKAKVLSKDIKEAICKVRTFFELEENAGKNMITIDKPRERTVATLGVSLRNVDRVYLESQVTGVHIYHIVNTYDIYIYIYIYIYLYIYNYVCIFHLCDQCCECNTSQMLSCVLLGYHVLINLF